MHIHKNKFTKIWFPFSGWVSVFMFVCVDIYVDVYTQILTNLGRITNQII